MYVTSGALDPALGQLENLVAAIGESGFGKSLLNCWQGICRADYCTVYHIDREGARSVTTASVEESETGPRQVALYLHRWQRDPMIAAAREQLLYHPNAIVHSPVSDLPFQDFRDILYDKADICDRVLACNRSVDGMTAICLLRRTENGAFGGEDVVALSHTAPLITTAIAKHIEVVGRLPEPTLTLRSREEIGRCVALSGVPFSQREFEVCVRILYGMSTCGIALDLGVGEETVMTYKKRAYARLGLASQRELLLWYIDAWQGVNLRGQASTH